MLVLTRNYSQAVHIGPLRLVVADGIGHGITLLVNQPPSGHTERHRLAWNPPAYEGAAVGHNVRVHFLGRRGSETVSLGIDAPDDVRIHREELLAHERAGGGA